MISGEIAINDLAKYLFESPRTIHDVSARDLKGLVKSLSSAHEQGNISEEDFSNIITYICYLLVEKEIEDRIERVLTRRMPFFSYSGK
jgi:hypothetical protein